MEYEYNQLMNIKQTHSKLNNLCYTKLELQNYLKLEVLNASEAQMLFKYRVRMASYGENFRGEENAILCPLCYTHLDSQKMCYENCPVLRQNIKISGSYNQIFDTSVSIEVVQTLSRIDRLRDENIVSEGSQQHQTTVRFDGCF